MKINLISIFVFLALVKITAQPKVTSLSPSVFYTYGNYSDGTYSASVSGFASVGLNYKDFIVAGFDRLLINSPTWKYDQKMFTLGGTKNIYPFYLRFFYSHISGDYNSKPAGYSYTDKLNVFDINMLYNYNLYFFGLSGNYISLDGFYDLSITHFSAVIKRLLGTNILLSANFTQSVVSDGRNLSSIKIDMNFKIDNSFSLYGSGAFGQRTYYYDDQLLTIFNQNETQKLNLNLTGKYLIIPNLTFLINYTYAEFDSYNINYFTAGIKFNIN